MSIEDQVFQPLKSWEIPWNILRESGLETQLEYGLLVNDMTGPRPRALLFDIGGVCVGDHYFS